MVVLLRSGPRIVAVLMLLGFLCLADNTSQTPTSRNASKRTAKPRDLKPKVAAMAKKKASGIPARRRGKVGRCEITNLGPDGIQTCDTVIMFQLFHDMPAKYFKDPNCFNPPNIFDKKASSPKQQGSFIGKDGKTTLQMRLEQDGQVAASINDYENDVLYHVHGIEDPNELDGLLVEEIPLENMLDEADIDDLTISSSSESLDAVPPAIRTDDDSRKRLLGGQRSKDEENIDVNKNDMDIPRPPFQPAPPLAASPPSPSALNRLDRPSNQRHHETPKRVRGVSSFPIRQEEPERRLSTTTITNLDIMVVWTKMAECELSSDKDENDDCRKVSEKTHKQMLAKVYLAVDETNQAFIDSDIPANLRLVHTYRHPKYKESDENRSIKALEDIAQGHKDLDDVHVLREEQGADLVAFIINSNDYCGVGYRKDPPIKEFMFSISHWDCATG